MTPTLEARLQRLEDLEQIRTVTARYAKAVDRGYLGHAVNAKELEPLFDQEVRWACIEGDYDFKGRDAVIAALVASPVAFAMHSFTNPIITIDGDTAFANWTLSVEFERHGHRLQTEDITYLRSTSGWSIRDC